MQTQWDSGRETYRFSASGKYVIRKIQLRDGRNVSTRLRIDQFPPNGESAKSCFDYTYLRKQSPPRISGSPDVHIVDLFSGCGGLTLGAMEACRATGHNFVPIAAFDNERVNLEVYEQNFQPLYMYSERIENLLTGEIGTPPNAREEQLTNRLGHIDILLAGPPCQGYSNLNNHTRRRDPRNTLYERVARFVELAHPTNVLIENVAQVIHGEEESVKKTIKTLQQKEYYIDSGIVDSAMVGVPQRRKRHFLVASKERQYSIDKIIKAYCVDYSRSVHWAISDLEDELDISLFKTTSKLSKKNQQRIQYLHKYDLYDLPKFLRPPCHRDKPCSYHSMYGRIKYSEPAQTITTGFSSPGQGRYVHPKRKRTLTPHEAARLQFFPDFFDFSCVELVTPLKKMIGNAVPMKLAYIFCVEFLA